MFSKNKNLLLAGTGDIAHEYAKVLTSNHKDVNLNIFSNDHERAVNFAEKYKVNSVSKNALTGNYDYIIVCSSEKNSVNYSKLFSSSFAKILYEKPLGASLLDTKKIIDNSNDNSYLALNRRFYPGINKLIELVKSSRYEYAIIMDQQSKSDFTKKRLNDFENNIVYANSIHIVDLVTYIVGKNSDNIYTTRSPRNYGKIYENEILIEGNQVKYFRANNIPGHWLIKIFYEDFSIFFSSMENFIVRDISRKVIYESSPRNNSFKLGFPELIEAFLSNITDSRLPKIEKTINLHSLMDSLS